MFFGQILVKSAKNEPRTFFNGSNRIEIENRKNAKILVNGVKSGLFGQTKR